MPDPLPVIATTPQEIQNTEMPLTLGDGNPIESPGKADIFNPELGTLGSEDYSVISRCN
jgi:hypothetical protein